MNSWCAPVRDRWAWQRYFPTGSDSAWGAGFGEVYSTERVLPPICLPSVVCVGFTDECGRLRIKTKNKDPLRELLSLKALEI